MSPSKFNFSQMTAEGEIREKESWWMNESEELREKHEEKLRDFVGHLPVPLDLVIKFKAFLGQHYYGYSKYAVTGQLAQFITFLTLIEKKEEAIEAVKYVEQLQAAIWMILDAEQRKNEIGEAARKEE